jgi:hypothetical protein
VRDEALTATRAFVSRPEARVHERAARRLALCLWLVLGALCAVSTRADATCDPATQCCRIECPADSPLPTTDECLADSCACAQKLDCYIRGTGGPQDWPLFPAGGFHLSTTPVHPRFLEVRINPESKAAAERFVDPSSGPVDYPPNTIIYKTNWLASRTVPGEPRIGDGSPFSTLMFKLHGYCPGDPSAGIDCAGGDWFFTGEMDGAFGVHGKVPLCINCHAAAQYGDWTWGVFVLRRFPPAGSGE